MNSSLAHATHSSDDGWTVRVAPGCTAEPGAWMFDRTHYAARGALDVVAGGRGSVAFVRHGDAQWVLRHYRRGGLPARLIRDRYLWLGLARTRPWRELAVLQFLADAGLPVPRPVAAGVRRRGLSYTGALLTEQLRGVETLDSRLRREALAPGTWRAIGALVARVHALGVHHSDLNVSNLLIAPDDALYLIDFDNALLRSPAWLRAAGVRRFRRSLRKASGRFAPFHYDASCWASLLDGYRDAGC